MPTYAFMCERCKKSFEVCSPSRSGLPRRLHARPVAAERSRPRWRSLPQGPHERAEDDGNAPYPDAAGYPLPGHRFA
jgi:hypothetical protein